MNITGEQIKDARERRQMTQQELADELGVSLRTVGSWERGESVPRSRMGAIRVVLRMEGPSDGRMELSRLINQELEESRRGPSDIVKGWSDGATRSFYGWKDGDTAPLRKSRAMLEDALGWRRGVVTDILEASITKTYTLSEIRDWSALPEPGLVKARELSTDELLIELTRRVGKMATELELLKAAQLPASHGDRGLYGLAASDEHVPGEDDRD
jgi:transcriptional regulator with XRE-family HTH domain